jgi:hypothetical protein
MSCSEMAKKGKRPGDRSCSQNAHDEAVLAWVKGASLRARGGWVGEKLRAVNDGLGTSLKS